jgi:hypothetical protein
VVSKMNVMDSDFSSIRVEWLLSNKEEVSPVVVRMKGS